MGTIRTTVSLDPDVAEQLKALAQRRNVSFRVALNAVVREGLAAERGENQPYRVASRPMGLRPGVDLTHALSLAESLEDADSDFGRFPGLRWKNPLQD